jgi:chorismate mutase
MAITSRKRSRMGIYMKQNGKYFVLKEKAVPEVLRLVVEAKRLLETGQVSSVQEAAEAVGISRSSFYKYKEDIFPFHADAQGKTLTFLLQMDDTPGVLSQVLRTVSDSHANILTIHQTIPINGLASLTLSVEVLSDSHDISAMIADMEADEGVHSVKILGRS